MKKLSSKVVNIKESSTLSITAKAKLLRQNGKNIISFGAGEPDFNTPNHINEAAIESINMGFTKYTQSSGTEELRLAICQKLKKENDLSYSPNQIVVSNGAKHSLFNIFTALLEDGDEVIIPAPFWLSYTQMVIVAGGKPVIVYAKEENGFKTTKRDLENSLTPKTKIIIVNSPNNPSGAVYLKEELEIIADFAISNDLYVVSDEIYEKLIFNDNIKHISIASLNEEIFKRTIVVNGFSKTYSMTGWRVGYTACSSEISEVMGNVQSHCYSNPNSIAQKAAFKAITGTEKPVNEMIEEFRKRHDYIYDRIINIPGLSATKPDGAFYVFVNVSKLCQKTICGKHIENAADLAEIFLDEINVAVVPAGDFGFDKYIRLSYSLSIDDIKNGMDRIEGFMKKYYTELC